jgi:glutathione S-transferase
MAAQLMLEHKGIVYERVDLIPGLHRVTMKALRFPGPNVPAIIIGDKRIQGTRRISRALDEIRPEPALFPADPDRRRKVEEAERFGDEVLQEFARRMAVCALKHSGWPALDGNYGRGRLNRRVERAMSKPAALGLGISLLYGVRDAVIQTDLIALPAVLDRIDAWIEEGVLNGDQLNAADFQIAPSLQILLVAEDYAQAFRGRPAEEFATRVAPPFPSKVGPALPRHWLEPLGDAVASQTGPGPKVKA